VSRRDGTAEPSLQPFELSRLQSSAPIRRETRHLSPIVALAAIGLDTVEHPALSTKGVVQLSLKFDERIERLKPALYDGGCRTHDDEAAVVFDLRDPQFVLVSPEDPYHRERRWLVDGPLAEQLQLLVQICHGLNASSMESARTRHLGRGQDIRLPSRRVVCISRAHIIDQRC
jgi:hypothetical protein